MELQHYIAAADLIIAKPGWGVVSEAAMILDPQMMKDVNIFFIERESCASNGYFENR